MNMSSTLNKVQINKFNNQYLKKKKRTEKKESGINWKENFKIESRYLRLCYEFSSFNRCVEAAFYWPDYQNFLTFKALWENQKLGREFEKLDRVLEKLGRVFEKSCRVFLSIYLYIYLTLAK